MGMLQSCDDKGSFVLGAGQPLHPDTMLAEHRGQPAQHARHTPGAFRGVVTLHLVTSGGQQVLEQLPGGPSPSGFNLYQLANLLC